MNKVFKYLIEAYIEGWILFKSVLSVICEVFEDDF